METSSNYLFDAFLEHLKSPGRSILGVWDYFLSWLGTRRWLSTVPMILPALALLAMFTFSVLDQVGTTEMLLSHYLNLLTDEYKGRVNETEFGADQLIRSEEITPRADLLLNRILQMDVTNSFATYYVARQLAARDRFGQARYMMREVAAEGARGFPPAHAWLAEDRLKRLGVKSRQEKLILLNDLQRGSQWEGSTALMKVLYADLLLLEKQESKALGLLKEAAGIDPRYWLRVVKTALDLKLLDEVDQATIKVEQDVLERINQQTATVQDYATMARLKLILNELDETIRYAGIGLNKESTDPVLRRALSEAYRRKYQATADVRNRRFNLDLLDAALKADGSNPAVTEEVAKLIAMGQETTPELFTKLQEKLSAGQATSLTHVLLANKYLISDELPKAISHLELAYRMSPRSSIILNNLGLAIARVHEDDPEQLNRADSLLTQAIKIAGPSAELYDSLGEIRMKSGKAIEAVQCFEAAIGADDTRLNTRRKLAEAYYAIGLEEMAQLQEKIIDQNSAPKAESNE